jgi:zeaxanthin glucosyltransferase
MNLPKALIENIFSFTRRSNVAELVSALDNVPEIIPCPAEFDVPGKQYIGSVHHIGPLTQKGIAPAFFAKRGLPDSKRIIYVSLGSQSALFIERAAFVLNAIYQAVRQDNTNDIFLILTIGQELNEAQFPEIDGKIMVLKWAPQAEILSKASIAITHGGLGTIKECIMNGVPMIVCPMIYDQFDNARRVVYHQLGLQIEIAQTSKERIQQFIHHVLNESK